MATLHKKHRKSDPLDALRPFAPGDSPATLRRERARRWLVKYPRAVPVGIFLAIIAITALSVYAIESNARARERAQLSERAESIVSALERRASSYAAFLRAGAALFAGREEVSPREFQQFVSELRLDDEHRGVEGIGWIRLVKGAELEDFVARQRTLQPTFKSIRPIPDPAREVIGPVTYFAPETSPYRSIIGFDMASEPVRAAAMQKAREAVRPIASGRVVLMDEGMAGVPGFDIFMPVYRRMEEGPGSGASSPASSSANSTAAGSSMPRSTTRLRRGWACGFTTNVRRAPATSSRPVRPAGRAGSGSSSR